MNSEYGLYKYNIKEVVNSEYGLVSRDSTSGRFKMTSTPM